MTVVALKNNSVSARTRAYDAVDKKGIRDAAWTLAMIAGVAGATATFTPASLTP